MSLKIPFVIGHRGAAAYAPENTIEGIRTAADMGVKWVELDVKLTKDSVPVIFHDDELDRTTNGHGLVAQTSFEDLESLEAGSWFSDSFAGIKIPTLEEAIEEILSSGLGLNLEIKPCPGREKETAEAALDVLSRIWDEPDGLLLSSFSLVSLETAQDMTPEWPRGVLFEAEISQNWREIASHLEAATLNVDAATLTRDKVAELLTFQRPILAYTVNNPERARELRSWGVDGVFTDDPESVHDRLIKGH